MSMYSIGLAKGKSASLWMALLVGCAVLGTAPGCGGGSSSKGGAKAPAAVSGDIATLAISITKGYSSGDPFEDNAAASVTQGLSKAGYKVVEDSREADLFARVNVTKEKQPSIVQIQVGGKTLDTYKIGLTLSLVDRDSKEIAKVTGSYTSDDGAVDEGAVSEMIDQVGTSAPLAAYAKSTKQARAEKAKEVEAQLAKEKEKKDREEAKAKIAEKLNRINNLRKDIDDIVQKGESAIPEDKLKEFKTLEDEVRKTSEDTARYYAHIRTGYTLENAWWLPESEGPAAIASTLGGELVAGGANDGKKLALSFNAKAGHCYTVVMRYRTVTGKEEIKESKWSGKGGNTPLQRYWVYSYGAHTQTIVGTCATKDSAVTLNADLIFAGTKNGLRYAVVGTPKAKFPMYVATYMYVPVSDSCDTDAWQQLWSDPIPGSIVYSGNEAYLLTSPDRAGQLWVTMRNASMQEVRARKPELMTAPPKNIKFSAQFKFPGCPRENAEGPDSSRLAKCHAQITAKYDPQWDAANKAKDNALTLGALRAARIRLDALDEAETKERERTCKPIEDQIVKNWEKAFNKVVDSYTDSPQKSVIDRVGELQSQEEGAP